MAMVMDAGTATVTVEVAVITTVGAEATITVGDNRHPTHPAEHGHQFCIARISAEILMVAKLEKVSDTA
jgi:hypothetical protein